MRTPVASAFKFPIKRRADFIVFTAGMLSDLELFSDAEAFAGPFRDAATCAKGRCRAGEAIGALRCSFRPVKRLGMP